MSIIATDELYLKKGPSSQARNKAKFYPRYENVPEDDNTRGVQCDNFVLKQDESENILSSSIIADKCLLV